MEQTQQQVQPGEAVTQKTLSEKKHKLKAQKSLDFC